MRYFFPRRAQKTFCALFFLGKTSEKFSPLSFFIIGKESRDRAYSRRLFVNLTFSTKNCKDKRMSDIMLRTLAEASQFLQQEEQVDAVSGTVLSKRLYSLLLKNVSKNDPLTQDELQVSGFLIFLSLYFVIVRKRNFENFALLYLLNNGVIGSNLREQRRKNFQRRKRSNLWKILYLKRRKLKIRTCQGRESLQ